MKWKAKDMPDQKGKIVIITGSNTGTGFHIAYGLASKEATVIMACRNKEKAGVARKLILKDIPNADIFVESLDLANLSSIHDFVNRIKNKYERVDLLVNNAGVMIPPKSVTNDGFELQFGTNHIGHFALSGLLLPLLENAGNARVITMSSIAHNSGVIDFEDLNSERKKYSKWGAYSQSKLANLIFSIEFQRRLNASNSSITSLASHPGWSATDLQRHSRLFRFLNYIFGMNPVKGAAPCLYAATMDDATNYPYWGVTKRGEMHGWTGKAKINKKANDEEVAKQLWDISCQLSQINYLN